MRLRHVAVNGLIIAAWRKPGLPGLSTNGQLHYFAGMAAEFIVSTVRQSLTVSELTAQIKELVESGFPSVWVVGEISNFSRPQSGHSYFTLKDEQAQIRAVIWRGTASKLKFDLADGLDVVCHGHLDVYAPRGSYQLVVDQLQPKGVGALELALRKLREKLAVNAQRISAHLEAVRSVVELLKDAMREQEADGTYSQEQFRLGYQP